MNQATDFLFARHATALKLGLDNIKKLCELLGSPEKKIKAIHIAGTNGKGSTAAILGSVLCEAGYRTMLYTSPHLYDVRERLRLCRKKIPEQEFISLINKLKLPSEASGASFFEIMTAAAFLWSYEQKADFTILETGLGGRLDATNVVTPLVSVITQIGYDHTKTLGSDLISIAREKAGIIKNRVPCVTGVNQPDVRKFLSDFAKEKGSEISFSQTEVSLSDIKLSGTGSFFSAKTSLRNYKKLHLNLIGEHQIKNAAAALSTVDSLVRMGFDIPEQAVFSGMKNVLWEGRIQVAGRKPLLLIDAAHNTAGMRTLAESIKNLFSYEKMTLVFGVLADKNYTEMLDLIVPLASRIILTKPLSPRALDPGELASLYKFGNTPVEIIEDIPKAWQKAVSEAGRNDLVCGAGSIYFIGEILHALHNQKT